MRIKTHGTFLLSGVYNLGPPLLVSILPGLKLTVYSSSVFRVLGLIRSKRMRTISLILSLGLERALSATRYSDGVVPDDT